MVGWSVGVHVGVVAVAVGAPAPGAIAPPDVITVDLVAGPPAPAPAAARPAPPPPPPAPKQVVLPERPNDPKPIKPEPKPKPRPKRKEVVLQPKPKVEKSLDDLLSEFREDAGETPSEEPPQQVASVAPSQGATGGVSAELADWIRRVKIRVKENWVVPPGFRMQTLVTRVEVELDASGGVRRHRVVARSGNVFYDEGVVRSLKKADPLPPPPEAGTFTLDFPSEDY